MIILMAGLPGTGKTTLARELAHRTKGALLSKDKIRAALFSAGRFGGEISNTPSSKTTS